MAEIEFTTFEAPVKENRYAETVKALADQNDPNAAVRVTVNAERYKNEQFLIQRAANDLGKTARVRHVDMSNATQTGETAKGTPIYEGEITMIFTLTDKHKARNKKSDDANVESAPAKSGKK